MSQCSLAELNLNHERQQDAENRNSYTVSRLIELTYNLNTKSGSKGLEDLSQFLPHSERYEAMKMLSEIEGISKQAALDYFRFKKHLDRTALSLFVDWEAGLKYLATH